MLEWLQGLATGAPVPAAWPRGWFGVLLLFCVPGGLGIPSGVLLARDDGIGAAATTVLYFLSDVLLALAIEPVLIALARARSHVPAIDRAGRATMLAIARVMPPGSLMGPVGVVLTAFGAGLPFGRVLASGAGYGLVAGWLLTIAGDMLYFGLGMASTLWLGGVLGDQRMAALAALAVMLVVSLVVRRVRASPG
jgi:hypothetical protein